MSRTTWILGNWKQNHSREAASACARDIAAGLAESIGTATALRAGVAPPYLSLDAAAAYCQPHSDLWLIVQDIAAQESGAFTGEVGAQMAREAGAKAAIVGHSERRAYFAEGDELLGRKVSNALDSGLSVVLCIGERLEARDAGEHESVVISQLSGALANVDSSFVDERLIIAYEPVWAIGTGRTASPEQARDMHRTIRAWMTERFGQAGADRSVLYGGSVKPGNAADLIAAGDIDGFLIGGASLDPTSFLAIVAAAARTPRT